MEEALYECARAALSECLNLRRQEKLLVICDPPCFDIGNAFWAAGNHKCKEAVMVMIGPRKQNGNEPPEPVGEWFSQFDVAVMPTSKSLSHTVARRNASEKGTRIATLPGITSEMFIRTMKADWRKLGTYTRKIAAQLSNANRVRITTELGMDFSFETGGRSAKADDARLTSVGAFGNLPAGEAYMAPLEGTSEGTLVIDGSFPLVEGKLTQPLVLRVREGKVVQIGDHPCAMELEKVFTKYRQHSRNIAEFGVGTLEPAIITGNTLEDEKVKGTIHVAIGDNASMGGSVQVPIHLDGVIKNPDVWLDDRLWIKNGQPV